MRNFLILFFIFFFLQSNSQEEINANQGYVENNNYFEKIPYEFINGKIIINVRIGNKSYRFLLDTGASSAISEKILKSVKTKKLGSVKMTDQSGITDSTNVVSVPKIKIGNINFVDIPAFVSKNDSNLIFECLDIEGIIGSNLLRNSTIQFDSKNKEIILTDKSRKLKLKKRNGLKIELNPLQSNPFVPVKYMNDKKVGNDFALFDSGDNNFFLLSNTAYEQLNEQIEIFELLAESKGSLSMGLFGSAKNNTHYLLNIPNLQLNNVDIQNVTSVNTYGKTSRIGSEIFKYAKVTIDFKKKLFWLEPFQNKKQISLKETLWPIEPVIDNNNKLVIGIIWNKQLTDRINVGDEILEFGSFNFSEMNYCDFLNSNFEVVKPKANLILKDKFTDEIKEIEINRL